MRIRRVISHVIELDHEETADVHMALCTWMRDRHQTSTPTQMETISKLAEYFSHHGVGEELVEEL